MKLKNKYPVHCPSCQKPMSPVVLGCSRCELELRGRFEENPFARLDADLAHFLHVFIHCEGKIADMEKALGISYPTVKAKMARLKEAVHIPLPTESSEARDLTAMDILAKIEKGELDYSRGLQMIKELQEKKK